MAGGNIVEHAAAHAHRIQQAIDAAGVERVEVLDAALALESHVDVNGELHRTRYPEFIPDKPKPRANEFQQRYAQLPGVSEPEAVPLGLQVGPQRTRIPPHPEYDMLWFIANYAPELEQWERDIFLAVRAESLYFYPVFACPDHERGLGLVLARAPVTRGGIPAAAYLPRRDQGAPDVVRPFASGEQTALAINPYHLGFTLWERIVDKHGLARARQVMKEEDDFGFIRNYLDRELAENSICSSTRCARATKSASRTATSRPCAKRSSPQVQLRRAARGGGRDQARRRPRARTRALERRPRPRYRPRQESARVHPARRRRPVRLHTVNDRGENVELTA